MIGHCKRTSNYTLIFIARDVAEFSSQRHCKVSIQRSREKEKRRKELAIVYGRNAEVRVWLGVLTGFTHV